MAALIPQRFVSMGGYGLAKRFPRPVGYCVLVAVLAAALTSCGRDASPSREQGSVAPASEDEQAITDPYSEKVREELTAAYVIAEQGEDSLGQYETGTAAWDGFVRTIKGLQQPGEAV